jgi:hypothetical protein
MTQREQHETRIGGAAGCASGRRGLTLIEVILALTLMIVLLSGVFAFYQTTLKARKEGGEIARDVLLARALLEQMADELRQATDIVPGDGIGFRGEREKLTIVRLKVPDPGPAYTEVDLLRDRPPAPRVDLERITYRLIWDPEIEDDDGYVVFFGLGRSVQQQFDPNPNLVVAEEDTPDLSDDGEEQRIAGPQAEGELYAPEIKYVRFQYFDGAEWRDTWQVADEEGGVDMGQAAASGQGTYALPQAVMITLGQEPLKRTADELERVGLQESEAEEEEEEQDWEYHPDRFTIIVHLTQADPSLVSSRRYGVADTMGRQRGQP